MTKNEIILDIKDCVDSTYGCDCAYYDVDGFAIAEEIYKRDYRKVERGEWKLFGTNVVLPKWECSVCQMTNPRATDFCPWCGADMRGEAE